MKSKLEHDSKKNQFNDYPIIPKVSKIRISIGTAAKLGLRHLKMNVEPTNIHLLTYNSKGCNANCAFCPQSKFTFEKLAENPDSQKLLSRVIWPAFDFGEFLYALKEKAPKITNEETAFKRICLQTLNYNGFEENVKFILEQIKKVSSLPISMAVPPVSKKYMKIYKKIGAERICFAIDCATEKIFDQIKGKNNNGPYSWQDHIEHLKYAVEIFGRGKTTTHLIVGLGETEFEALKLIWQMKKMGILTGIFAFCPIKNTKLEKHERPSILKFRKIQLGKFLIDTGKKKFEDFEFDDKGNLINFNISIKELNDICNIGHGKVFQTSGCPGCNRPYYTSSPNSVQYNYPRKLTNIEIQNIIKQLRNFITIEQNKPN
ncbi:MAG: radical SAM protein [Promethearchaeota archaeon]